MKSKTRVLFLAGLLLIPVPLLALSLTDAKSQGLVAETSSGYIEPRSSTGGVRALVQSVNAKRKERYRAISARNGTSLSVVEKLAGEKLIKRGK